MRKLKFGVAGLLATLFALPASAAVTFPTLDVDPIIDAMGTNINVVGTAILSVIGLTVLFTVIYRLMRKA